MSDLECGPKSEIGEVPSDVNGQEEAMSVSALTRLKLGKRGVRKRANNYTCTEELWIRVTTLASQESTLFGDSRSPCFSVQESTNFECWCFVPRG